MGHNHNHDDHTHSHNHSHSGHSHTHNANKKALTISFILITSFMFVEFIGGYLTHSLALISDAGHMLSDAVALGLSLSALIFGARAATHSKTYGYKRFEILAALLNGIVLVLLAIFIFKEAIDRLSDPPQVMGKGMMIISVIGLIINIIVAYILHSQGSTEDNLNVRSAFMHVIGDLLGSVGAIVAAILIMLFGWYIADSIASMIVSVLVLYSGWNVLKESVNILMEAKPYGINFDEVMKLLKSIDGVEDIHDLHIWMITSDFSVMTAHLKVKKDMDRDAILEKAKSVIETKFGIRHVTIQIEGREVCPHEEICN
ncbi:cobalt-zinc-cadmium efflux system protein [Dysgonomonas hofstadii]|uniref:Cobalt-zinc-cadmium efflux system protein n=1 Tax=Dysgonomonas hofstadii TaxID=637886 RepID=A0A840CIM0_9BACT|nr:cation diffusion facilitator family transporter [Dysgonomonas hofstadii]MBB4035176.1 cobalt-zinc-cadmium efflux system protein [Dysgonomonas hofstadii]